MPRRPTADLPSFSVIVPTYQRREMVCAALRSICEMRYDGDAEIVVVIDGSTDGTAQALRKIRCRYPLQMIEQPNRGLAAARNRGAAEARNEILLFLDDDMICEPDLLEQHARMYREGADAVSGDIPLHPASARGFLTDWIATAATWTREDPPDPFDICGGQLSVRRGVFKQLGGFDEQMSAGGAYGDEDVEFALRLTADHRVRHNPAAISRQMNLVSAREFMDRSRDLARADLMLMAKHPNIAERLLSARGAGAPVNRLFYRPLARLPAFPYLFAKAAVRLSDAAVGTRFGSNPLLARAFIAARSIAYWAELRRSSRSARS